MPVLLRALLRKRVYATFPSPYQTASKTTLTTTAFPQAYMQAITGIPSIEFINHDESSNATSDSLTCVDIAIKYSYSPCGEVIAAGVPLQPLKEIAPILLQYLTTDGAQILLPRSEAIDWTLLLNLVDLIVEKHCSEEVFDVDFHELLREPVKSVKLHIILELFGLSYQAGRLSKQLWLELETHTLKLTDVFWMYGALVPHKDVEWMAESTELYLQMLAWNILNADAQGTLHEDLRTFFLEDEGKPYHLTRILKDHFDRYQLGRAELESGRPTSKKRRDTAIERIDWNLSPCGWPISSLDDALVEGPIFPARWLPPPGIDGPSKVVPDEALSSEIWNCELDEERKSVRQMALEREELVSLRRSEAFTENVGNIPVYAEFGYPGWCDGNKPRKKRSGI